MQGRLLIQEQLTPAHSLAADRFCLRQVAEAGEPVLRIYTLTGDAVLFGCYHAVGELANPGAIQSMRRMSGGRIVPAGEGFVQFAFVIPHRSFFVSADSFHLAPFQVLNRYVRGVLQGLKTAGVEVFYPGRDLLTVQQKPIGWGSFTTEENGTLLCEGGVSVTRDFGVLPYLLDQVDPQGTVPSQFYTPAQVTSLEQVTGKTWTFAEVATLLQHGFAQHYRLDFASQAMDLLEQGELHTPLGHTAEEWLRSRQLRTDFPLHASTTTQLGILQVYCSLTAEKTLAEVQLSGDFIADPSAIIGLEHALCGCPLEYEALWRIVNQTFLQPQHYLLGVGRLETVVETLLRCTGQL